MTPSEWPAVRNSEGESDAKLHADPIWPDDTCSCERLLHRWVYRREVLLSDVTDEDLGDVSKHGTNCGWYESYGESGCTCSLKWRMALKTERQMHRAWRKRAEEAEARFREAAGIDREPRTAAGSLD